MNNYRKKMPDFVSQIVLPVFAVSLIVIAFYIFSKIAGDMGVILVIINVLLGCVLGVFLQYRSGKRRQRDIRNIIDAIEAVRSDKEVISDPDNSSDLRAVFDSLVTLSQNLKKQDKNRYEILNIVNSAAANMELELLLESLMPKLLESTHSNWGAFYLANNSTNKLEIKAAIGFSKNIYSEFDITIGEGFIGAAALTKEPVIIKDIPDDTVYITKTVLGKIKPRNLMLVPIINQDQLMGVLALASVYDYTGDQMEIVDLIKYYVGAAVKNGVIYERSKRLTNELRFQNKLIQDLNIELETKMNERNLFLNNIMDSIKDYAIYAMDNDGVVLTWNVGAEIMYGYKAEEIVGKNISFIFSADEITRGTVRKRLDSARENGRYVEHGWRKRRDGQVYYVDVMIFAMYNQNGSIIGLTNVSKDITDLKNMQDDLLFEKALSGQLFENNALPELIINYNNVVEKANLKALELFGCDSLPNVRINELFEDTGELQGIINRAENLANCVIKCKNGQTGRATVIGINDDTGFFRKTVITIEIID